MWYSGIDQHKQFCVITTYGPEGPRVKQARVASTALALSQYFAEFPGPHRAVVESTGGWYWLADTLAGLGVELVLAHATRVKAIAAAKVKTDQVDSDTLALLLRADLIPTAHMIAPAQRGPRDLMRTRLRLVEKNVSAQNSIDRLLEKFNLASVTQLEACYQLQAGCHSAQMALLESQIATLGPTAGSTRAIYSPGSSLASKKLTTDSGTSTSGQYGSGASMKLSAASSISWDGRFAAKATTTKEGPTRRCYPSAEDKL
jgi:Transposase